MGQLKLCDQLSEEMADLQWQRRTLEMELRCLQRKQEKQSKWYQKQKAVRKRALSPLSSESESSYVAPLSPGSNHPFSPVSIVSSCSPSEIRPKQSSSTPACQVSSDAVTPVYQPFTLCTFLQAVDIQYGAGWAACTQWWFGDLRLISIWSCSHNTVVSEVLVQVLCELRAFHSVFSGIKKHWWQQCWWRCYFGVD